MTTPSIASTVYARTGDVLVVPSTILAHADGSAVNLTGATVTFQMFPTPGGTALVNAAATVLNIAAGIVTYLGTTGDTAFSGSFNGYFVVTTASGSTAYPSDGIDVVIYPAIGALTGPQVGPCFPWTTADAVRGAVAGIDPLADLTEWIEAADQVLHLLLGKQFKGLCRATIRPGHESCSCGGLCVAHAFGWPLSGGFGLYGSGWGGYGAWRSGQEGPRNTLICASEIDLGHEARLVESIKIDGAEIDPTTWRLDPLGKLVRQPDANGNQLVWPCCSRVGPPSGSVGTFEIRYLYGLDPPASVVMAVNVLAGQFWLASNGSGQCKLPSHIQTMTRQGVSATFITDTSVFLAKGFTGLPLVDQVIAAFNPNHVTRRARVISIDVEPHRRMTP